MNIYLHIERLVLDGTHVAGGNGALVQRAIVEELARLMATGKLRHHDWQSGPNVHHLQAGAIRVTQEAGPVRLGEQIAGAIYGGLFE